MAGPELQRKIRGPDCQTKVCRSKIQANEILKILDQKFRPRERGRGPGTNVHLNPHNIFNLSKGAGKSCC